MSATTSCLDGSLPDPYDLKVKYVMQDCNVLGSNKTFLSLILSLSFDKQVN